MTDQADPEPLSEILGTYCDPNSFELVNELRGDLASMPPETARLFRQQLGDAIAHGTMSPTDYKRITTDNEYNTPEQLRAWLLELWELLYDDPPPA